MLKYKIGLQLLATWMMTTMTSLGLGNVLEGIWMPQPQRIYVVISWNSINHGLMKSAQNY